MIQNRTVFAVEVIACLLFLEFLVMPSSHRPTEFQSRRRYDSLTALTALTATCILFISYSLLSSLSKKEIESERHERQSPSVLMLWAVSIICGRMSGASVAVL